MNKNLNILLGIPIILLFTIIFCAAETQNLSQKYKDWLALVSYIITPVEKEIFLSLKDDKSRDLFISAFWHQRDPTIGTPENEYRDEIEARFSWANKYLKDGSRPGWQTDRGKFYIILGEPKSKTRVETINVYPAEIWYYYAPPDSNLPAYFALLFYKKYGAGEYKLYDPFSDGPDKLFLQRQQYDPYNYELLYEKLKELDYNLAEVSLSLIPGEIPMNFMPSPRTPYIIANILDLPKKSINIDYAVNFNKYKGIVEEEYSVNYIPNHSSFYIIKNTLLNLYFVHYAIKLKTISINAYKEKYYTNFELNGVIKDEKGKIIFQYKKTYPIYFTEKQLESFQQNEIVFLDMVPIIEGNFLLRVLIKNTLSKEFTIAEYAINLNKYLKTEMSEPIIAYDRKEHYENESTPFGIGAYFLDIDPELTFIDTDSIFIYSLISNIQTNKMHKLSLLIQLEGKEVFSRNYQIIAEANDYLFAEEIRLQGYHPGNYYLKLSLLDENNNKILEKKSNFSLTPLVAIARPSIVKKSTDEKNYFLFYQIIGEQYFITNKYNEALDYFTKAYNMNSNYLPSVKRLIETMLALNRIKESIELIGNLKIENFDAELLYLIGNAYEVVQDNEKAETYYNKSLQLSREVSALNALGKLYLKLGNKERAKELLSESLQMKNDQKDIQELIRNIKLIYHN